MRVYSSPGWILAASTRSGGSKFKLHGKNMHTLVAKFWYSLAERLIILDRCHHAQPAGAWSRAKIRSFPNPLCGAPRILFEAQNALDSDRPALPPEQEKTSPAEGAKI